MGKTSPPSPLNKIDLPEDWNGHPAVEWLSANKQIIIWVILGLIALLILSYRFVVMQAQHAESDYFHAQTVFTQFQKESQTPNGEAGAPDLKELQVIMGRHPELKPKYEGALAQTLLVTGQVAEATPMALDIFKRTQADAIQLYQNYSKSSLLISDNNYGEALRQSQQLQQTLDQLIKENGYETLIVLNLIRLAMLHQQLGNSEEEIKSWEMIENLPSNLQLILENHKVFNQGKASLSNYIQERKKTLTKS